MNAFDSRRNGVAWFFAAGLWAALAVAGGIPVRAQSGFLHDASGNLVAYPAPPATSPPVLRGPASRLVPSGRSTSLSVTLLNGPVSGLSYRWLHDGNEVSGARKDTLFLATVGTNHVGNYQVVVSGGFGAVTSVVARVELDTDRDGLGDVWEITQFGGVTEQKGGWDTDQDGANERREFLNGTNPNDRQSLRPELRVWAAGGDVRRILDKPDYSRGETVLLEPVPEAGASFIGWTGDLSGNASPGQIQLQANAEVQAIFGRPLAEALDTSVPISTGGRGGWMGQTRERVVGGSAAVVAPPLAGTGDAMMEATLVAARDGTVSFWWKVDAWEGGRLSSSLLGSGGTRGEAAITGPQGWVRRTQFLPAGTHRLRWVYDRAPEPGPEDSRGLRPPNLAYVDGLSVEDYPDPSVDRDANGLPDLWEYRHFERMGMAGNEDPDRDGVPTAVEFADGTEPNSRFSVRPRLAFEIEGRGRVVTTPSVPVYVRGQSITNTAIAESGWTFMGWVGPFDGLVLRPVLRTANPTSDFLNESRTYRAVFGLPAGPAAGLAAGAWSTSPGSPWYGQTAVRRSGDSAAQSCLAAAGGPPSTSWLETNLEGPGTLSFFWKMRSAGSRDRLSLVINGVASGEQLSTNTDWVPVVWALPAGTHNLRWHFERAGGFGESEASAGWVEGFAFTPGVNLPSFVLLPGPTVELAGRPFTLQTAARGTPPITFQVFRGPLPLTFPSTNPVIVVSNVPASLSGDWLIRARNPAGTTDSPAFPVNLLRAPVNDDFANRTTLPDPGIALNGYTLGATAESSEPFHADYSARASVWHQWTAANSGPMALTVTVTNPVDRLAVAVYSGTRITTLREVGARSVQRPGPEDSKVVSTTVAWYAEAGTTYSLAIDAGDAGAFYQARLQSVPAPANDAFADRFEVQGTQVILMGDNSIASAEPGEPAVFEVPEFPQLSVPARHTLWWAWTAPVSGRMSLEDFDGDISPSVFVYRGTQLDRLERLTREGGFRGSYAITAGTSYAIGVDAPMDRPGGAFRLLLTLDLLELEIQPPSQEDPGQLVVRGPPRSSVKVEFSPNLRDWYPWSRYEIPAGGTLEISLTPPSVVDISYDPEMYDPEFWFPVVTSIPPARNRFFRIIRP